jgi:HTH-type transcriptional regulator/antitoxin HipB
MTTIRQLSELSVVLKSMRKQLGLSQGQVGAALGLSQERISAMENHPERLTVDNLFSLLMVLEAELSLTNSRSVEKNQDPSRSVNLLERSPDKPISPEQKNANAALGANTKQHRLNPKGGRTRIYSDEERQQIAQAMPRPISESHKMQAKSTPKMDKKNTAPKSKKEW